MRIIMYVFASCVLLLDKSIVTSDTSDGGTTVLEYSRGIYDIIYYCYYDEFKYII